MSEYNPVARHYELAILSGEILAGELLIAAVKRHRQDLKDGHERGLYFDHEAGQRMVDFFQFVNLSPNNPIKLFPFQVWELYVFYGWKRGDGRRRFRLRYKTCAKGNGKTPLEAGQIMYHLTLEQLTAAEAYVTATTERQAKICFDDGVNMLTFSPQLQLMLGSSAEQIYNEATKSKFRFLTSKPAGAEGTRPSYVCVDEYHEFEDDKMVNKLSAGLIKKAEPILSIVTTRGDHKEWPCAQRERKVFVPLLKGSVFDDSIFVLIYSQDSEDEFDKPKTWIKSNPMLCPGGVLDLQTLIEEKERKKLEGEVGIVSFKTLNLNWWCDAPQIFIPEEIWLKSGSRFNPKELESRDCWAGLDMGATDDFCAFSLYFPPADWQDYEEFDVEQMESKGAMAIRSPIRVPGNHYFLWWFWIPEFKNQQRIANGVSQLLDWKNGRFISILDGNVIDPRSIEADIKDLIPQYNIRKLSFDRFNAVSTALSLQEKGLPVEIFTQDMSTLNGPTKGFRDLAMQQRLFHNHNPVAQWMMRNAVPIVDTKGNIMLTKDPKRSVDKIDGIVAAIMAMGGWMMDKEATNTGPSSYDTEGIFYV